MVTDKRKSIDINVQNMDSQSVKFEGSSGSPEGTAKARKSESKNDPRVDSMEERGGGFEEPLFSKAVVDLPKLSSPEEVSESSGTLESVSVESKNSPTTLPTGKSLVY
mmetsp:Transcript_35371/g.54142  ORF Transcript_35371/g.54142 Transcript_35371/m.54142 type:complete len:108 (+) Transcript_35371:5903-6226(+)